MSLEMTQQFFICINKKELVINMKKILFFIFYITVFFSIYAEENDLYTEDFISLILEQFGEKYQSLEIIDVGIYDDGINYTVYKIDIGIKITISTDDNTSQYIIGNVESNETMKDILDYLTGIFTEPIPYINGDGFTAFFYDTENLYIKEDFADYIGTFTVYGNHLFVEEAIKQEQIIVQRQWCTPDFFEISNAEMGEGWGFVASWDKVEYIAIDNIETENQGKEILPAQYKVRSWIKTKDSFYSIAGMPFIYGDPRLWQVLYYANINKLPDPDDPDLIYPGTVLDIPSLKGEERSGLWTFDNKK